MRVRFRRISSRIRRSTASWKRRSQFIPLVILALSFFALISFSYYFLLNNGDFDHSLAKSLLRIALPLANGLQGAERESYNFRSLIYALTGYDLRDPLSFLEGTLPIVPQMRGKLRQWEERPFVFVQELSFAPDPVKPERPMPQVERDRLAALTPQVLIYHTHTSEMYLGRSVPASQSAQAHYTFRNLADPTITGVLAVGRHLTNALVSFGISTVHETRIHTLPSINNSYSNSEKTVRELVNRYKDLQLVIDLHRDAGVPNPSVRVNERNVARLLLVVGTAERIPLAHPNFQQNLDLAQKIKAVCDEMYPGLMRPIQVQKDARYNQHLHPHSIIVEVGSVENTLEEALLTAELLANVLYRVLASG